MNKFIRNKKILALALCLSITAGQANAINWSSIGQAIVAFSKSAVQDFKAPTWQNSKLLFATLPILAANNIISQQLYRERARVFTKKVALTCFAVDAVLFYALSPVAFNLKYIYKPLIAIYCLLGAYKLYELFSLKSKKKYIIKAALNNKKLELKKLKTTKEVKKFKEEKKDKLKIEN